MDYWNILRDTLGNQQLILNSAVGAIIKDNKILLARQSPTSRWYLPGGMQELNESLQDTVIRGVKEEYGLNLVIDKLIGIYSSPKWIMTLSNGDVIQQVIFFFLLKGKFNESDIVLQKSELSEYAFFNLDDIPEHTMECCKEKISDFREFNGTVFLK